MLIALFVGLATTARAQGLTNYTSYQTVGRSIVIATDSGQLVRLTSYGASVVRVQAIQGGAFLPDDHYDMVERHDVGLSLAVADAGAALDLTAGSVRVHVTKAPLRLAFYRAGEAAPVVADAGGVVWPGGGVAQRFAVDATEHFAGLGHGFFGRVAKLDLTGTEVARNYGAQQIDQAPLIVPFYLSSKGYGVFVNSAFTNRFRFNVTGQYEVFLAGASEMDYFVLLGPGLPDVLAEYVGLTGKPRLPPAAMFGLALSDKADPAHSGDAWWRAKVHEQRAHGWPIDHLINDNSWRAGGNDRCVSRFDWDLARYPDPAAFETWAKAQGLVATLDFNRCIANQSAGWQAAFNLPDPGVVEFGQSVPDVSSPTVRAWWWNLLWTKTLDPAKHYPGDALWIDEFDEMGSAPATQTIGDGRTWGEMRNAWFGLIARALGAEGWDVAFHGTKRPFIWVRGGTAGGQRAATLWSGDIDPTYAEMRLQLRGMLAAGLAGFPYWGHDAGGFHGEAIDQATFDEIYRQWSLAFGAFTPYWKPHGTVYSRWPIDRSPDAQHLADLYGDLRYRLMPYTYSAAREAAETGMPIARAMLLAYNTPEAWASDQQYLWGASLLVAPNPAAGYNNVPVWLPPGTWYDFWTDTKLDGNRTLQAWAPPGRTPLYAKAGAIIPMAPASAAMAFQPHDVLDVHVYDGADGSFVLREDDGTTEGYRGTEHRETMFEYAAASRTLTIHAAQGTYNGAPATRRYRVYFHGLAQPACAGDAAQLRTEHDARYLGAGTAWLQNPTSGTAVAVVPAAPVDQDVAVGVHACTAEVPMRFELETATTNATVTAKPSASGGKYVGNMNAPGAYVEITVTADTDGDRDVIVGYANGRPNRAVRGLYLDGARVADVVFATTPDWDAFRTTPPVRVALHAGTHKLRIQTDAMDPETVDLDFIDVYTAAPAAPAPFYQVADVVCVEAEHYGTRTDTGGQTWREITFAPGYAGDGAVQAWPALGVVASDTTGPRLDYPIELATGAHAIWVRGHEGSVTVGIDGHAAGTITLPADDFGWAGSVAIDAPPGTHTLSLWMAKDGAIVDRIVLATDRPDGVGPDESPHTPPMAQPDGAQGGGGNGGCCEASQDGRSAVLFTLIVFVVLRRRGASR